jgi:alpha-L-rhamnosidase
MVNRLFKNIVWTQRANFVDIPTDCPQRDERLGWMGDAQIYVRAASYNADVNAFFTKWMDDVEESQLGFGAYPDYAPYPMSHGQPNKSWGTAWTDAGIICPWTIWKVYGDTTIIRRHYASMQRFMEFRKAISPKYLGVSIGNDWGDWLNMNEPTPVEYIDCCYFARSSELMAEMAQAIGKKVDAANYRRLFDNIKAAFNREYVKPDGSLKVDSQTAYVLALSFGLLPEKLVKPASDILAQKIVKNDFRMATGFLGTKPLLPVLTATGHHDLAVRLFQSRKNPSWGYEVANDATTIWERWDSYSKGGTSAAKHVSMNSFAHYSFGAVCEWMFQSLAGIDTDGPGFKNLILRPGPPTPGSNPDEKSLDWVKAEYDSPTGKIVSQWKREANRFELNLSVPANTAATLYLPAGNASQITESGRPLAEVKDIQILGAQGDRVLMQLGSGEYRFKSAL